MGIDLNTITHEAHSIAVKDSTNGYELSIDSAGKLSVKIEDDGNSITVDGTVAATQSGSWDIGTVTTLTGITNDVNIADGGNSITIDGDIGTVTTLTGITNDVSIDDGGNSITVDGAVSASFGGYPVWEVTAETVGTSESELVSTPLANREAVEVQNLSNNDIYVRALTGVSTGNGLMIPKRSSWEKALDVTANIFAIAGTGAANDIRIAEYASA